ncbi:MAG: helix-turn-helix domain-containing protein [Pseudonocardiaceae bacterium]
MAGRDDEAAARAERARAIGLFRYQLIRAAADPGLSSRARGRLVREIAASEHLNPAGRAVRVSRDTLDRWIRAWRHGGFDALVPSPRQSTPRLPVELVQMAVALKRENPGRTAAQVRRILAGHGFPRSGVLRPERSSPPGHVWAGSAVGTRSTGKPAITPHRVSVSFDLASGSRGQSRGSDLCCDGCAARDSNPEPADRASPAPPCSAIHIGAGQGLSTRYSIMACRRSCGVVGVHKRRVKRQIDHAGRGELFRCGIGTRIVAALP